MFKWIELGLVHRKCSINKEMIYLKEFLFLHCIFFLNTFFIYLVHALSPLTFPPFIFSIQPSLSFFFFLLKYFCIDAFPFVKFCPCFMWMVLSRSFCSDTVQISLPDIFSPHNLSSVSFLCEPQSKWLDFLHIYHGKGIAGAAYSLCRVSWACGSLAWLCCVSWAWVHAASCSLRKLLSFRCSLLPIIQGLCQYPGEPFGLWVLLPVWPDSLQ